MHKEVRPPLTVWMDGDWGGSISEIDCFFFFPKAVRSSRLCGRTDGLYLQLSLPRCDGSSIRTFNSTPHHIPTTTKKVFYSSPPPPPPTFVLSSFSWFKILFLQCASTYSLRLNATTYTKSGTMTLCKWGPLTPHQKNYMKIGSWKKNQIYIM